MRSRVLPFLLEQTAQPLSLFPRGVAINVKREEARCPPGHHTRGVDDVTNEAFRCLGGRALCPAQQGHAQQQTGRQCDRSLYLHLSSSSRERAHEAGLSRRCRPHVPNATKPRRTPKHTRVLSVPRRSLPRRRGRCPLVDLPVSRRPIGAGHPLPGRPPGKAPWLPSCALHVVFRVDPSVGHPLSPIPGSRPRLRFAAKTFPCSLEGR